MPQPHAKLTDEEQYQVCQWYGEFKSPTQIMHLIKEHFGKTLDLKNVWQYAHGNQMKKWKPLIERLRQEWVLGIMDIPLAHKRARLEKLVSLYNRADRNEKVDEFHKIKQCVDILAEMRAEMEAGKSEFTNVYMTTIHTYSDEEILKQRDRILERLKHIRRSDGQGHGSEAATGAGIREAEIVPGGGSGGGGPAGGQLGEGDAETPDPPTDSSGTGVQVLEADDARADGTRPEGEGTTDGPVQEADGSVRLRHDAEDGVGTEAGTGQPQPPTVQVDG